MPKTYSNRSNAARAAKAAGLADFSLTEADGRWTFATAPEPTRVVALATADEDLGLVPEGKAMIVAIEHATETGETVTIRVALTDAIIETVEAPEPEAGKRRKAEAPSGMVAKIIALALRPEGVSPAELNTVTEWKGAPWKWLFSNPKGTGYADRWGYRLDVTKDGKATTYRLTASATA